MMRNSSPSILISVPEYLPNRTRSPCFYVEREDLAFVVGLAFADGDDFTFLGLFLGGVGDDDAATDGFTLFDTTNQDAIVQRSKGGRYGCSCHCVLLLRARVGPPRVLVQMKVGRSFPVAMWVSGLAAL